MLAGEFAVVNEHLLKDCNVFSTKLFIFLKKILIISSIIVLKRDIWSPELKNEIIARHGSVQGIPEIPLDLQMLYRTVWEIKQV